MVIGMAVDFGWESILAGSRFWMTIYSGRASIYLYLRGTTNF